MEKRSPKNYIGGLFSGGLLSGFFFRSFFRNLGVFFPAVFFLSVFSPVTPPPPWAPFFSKGICGFLVPIKIKKEILCGICSFFFIYFPICYPFFFGVFAENSTFSVKNGGYPTFFTVKLSFRSA